MRLFYQITHPFTPPFDRQGVFQQCIRPFIPPYPTQKYRQLRWCHLNRSQNQIQNFQQKSSSSSSSFSSSSSSLPLSFLSSTNVGSLPPRLVSSFSPTKRQPTDSLSMYCCCCCCCCSLVGLLRRGHPRSCSLACHLSILPRHRDGLLTFAWDVLASRLVSLVFVWFVEVLVLPQHFHVPKDLLAGQQEGTRRWMHHCLLLWSAL